MADDYGMKVSKAGFNVLTTGDTNLLFSSKYNVFKVAVEGSGTLSASANVDKTHSLGYVPHFLVFMEDQAGDMRIVNGSGFIATEQFIAYADTSKINIENQDGGNSKDYIYFIFYDPI